MRGAAIETIRNGMEPVGIVIASEAKQSPAITLRKSDSWGLLRR
jgi:hypothetical protein